MTRYTALPLLLLLLLLSAAPDHSSAAVSDSLKDACAKFVYPDLCLKALGDDPRSATADFHGLALISLDLSVASANAISSSYAQQRREPSLDAAAKNSLDGCLLLYQNNFPLLDYARKFLEGGQPGVGRELLDQAMWVPVECDGGIKDGGKANLADLILLARRFMELLDPQ
ncbi:pectinesterase inhibitor-like [Zingiber officinale]|uniref:pectinesterase inhibitor-like n=1 Tax=Zingiber officinale TaxID=94328 RepID=UPI001C4C8F4E|nr:pectinesterase inhibitor-like [Zingiber officinale]